MDDRIRIDKLPQPVPWPELASLLAERAGLQERVRGAVVDHLPVYRAADAVARARAEAAGRGEELDGDAPELLALAAAREEEEAAEVLRVALGDVLAAVDTDTCSLLDSTRATYLDLLGKSRAKAEERVGAALAEAREALSELGRSQALYAYLRGDARCTLAEPRRATGEVARRSNGGCTRCRAYRRSTTRRPVNVGLGSQPPAVRARLITRHRSGRTRIRTRGPRGEIVKSSHRRPVGQPLGALTTHLRDT